MTDEKFVYTQDCRDKKITARSARHKRSHRGKGGAVKLPSDYMTKKEINAMNGKVETYRLNDPMKWDEFKAMPDEHKVSYIKLLRAKYNVPDRKIADMLGVSQRTVSVVTRQLGIPSTHGAREEWDKEGWVAFVNGVRVRGNANEDVETIAEVEQVSEEVKIEPVADAERTIPQFGSLTFYGPVDNALKYVGGLIGGTKCRISISWEVE